MHCSFPSSLHTESHEISPLHLPLVQHASTDTDCIYTDVEGYPQLKAVEKHMMREEMRIEVTAIDNLTTGSVTTSSIASHASQVDDTDIVSKGVPESSTTIIDGGNHFTHTNEVQKSTTEECNHSIGKKAQKPLPLPKTRKQNITHTLSSSYVDTDELHPSSNASYFSLYPGVQSHSSIYTAPTPTQSSASDGKIGMYVDHSEMSDMPQAIGYQALNPHTIDYMSLYCSTDQEQSM